MRHNATTHSCLAPQLITAVHKATSQQFWGVSNMRLDVVFPHPSLPCPLIAFCIRFASGLIPSPLSLCTELQTSQTTRLAWKSNQINGILPRLRVSPCCSSACSFFPTRCSLPWHIPFSRVLRVAKAFGNASNSFASFHSAASVDSLLQMELCKKNRLN